MPTGIYGSPALGPYANTATSNYPVSVEFIIPARNSRFLAIPLLGFLVRYLFLIPHYFVLVLLGILVTLSQLFLWIPVLVGGRYPRWGYGFVGGYIRWNTRVQAYHFGLTDAYPPFSLSR
jgi:hypothetical protein